MKNKRKLFWILSLVTILFIQVAGCGKLPEKGEAMPKEYSLLTDSTFENGLTFSGSASNIASQIEIGKENFGAGNKTPEWRLDQWACRYNLFNTKDKMTEKDGKYTFTDTSKQVVLDRKNGGFSLELNSSLEYVDESGRLKPRKDGEAWPHLLMEQPYLYKNKRTHDTKLGDLKQLRYVIEFEVEKKVDYRSETVFNPNLHAGQFVMFSTIMDSVAGSAGAGSGIWFGFQFFDDRYAFPPENAHQDGGKEDATDLFIFSPDMKEIYNHAGYYEESVQTNKKYYLEIDALPYIYQAIATAQAQGFVEKINVDNLSYSSMNIGFEHPGIFDMKVNVTKLDIVAVRKD